MIRVIEVNQDKITEFNVLYDAITKHENSDGILGLRKITKLLDKIEEIGNLNSNVEDINIRDTYSLKDKTKTYNLFLDDDEITSIKQWFDKVKWHPMKARLIVNTLDWVEAAKEYKLEVLKEEVKK